LAYTALSTIGMRSSVRAMVVVATVADLGPVPLLRSQ